MNPKSGTIMLWQAFLLIGAGIALGAGPAYGDQTIMDNVIIQGQVTIQEADTPTVLLQQTSPAYSWTVEANETNFSVHDTTAGQFPLVITAAAPSNSIFVSASGAVGIGTSAPGSALHVSKASQAGVAELITQFAVSDDPVGRLVISNNSAGDGIFIPKMVGRSASSNAALIVEALITNDTGASPAIVYNAAKLAGGALATRPLVVYRNNSVAKATITAAGDINATSFNPTSSRSVKDDIVDLDSRKAADAIRQLTPVEFVYKDDDSREKRVGFIAEDVPEIVANADRQSVPIMDVVALVTRVVKDQQQTIESQKTVLDEQRKSIEGQQKTIDQLMKRLNSLEGQLQGR